MDYGKSTQSAFAHVGQQVRVNGLKIRKVSVRIRPWAPIQENTMENFDLDKVREFIRNTSNTTRIYIGADSERYCRKDGVWQADYTVAVVIHYDGNKGCKVFGQISSEVDYDRRKDRPAYRLMNEVYKASQMYMDLEESIGNRHVEVHLDINPDYMHGSSCVVTQAIGYVRGVTNITPMVKPEAFAASYAADRLKEILVNN